MSSRVQTALINQLQKQIRQHTAYETAKLYLDLRHRIEQHNLINEHFSNREKNISEYVIDSYNKHDDIIKINQMRFNLRIDERLELIFDNNTHNFTNYKSPDVNDVQELMHSKMNDFLFFKNAYTSNVYTNSDNMNFYLIILVVIALMFKI
ncbi:hypothetical protein PBCVNY2B_551L [Paramecium bursaria Chlorella virus NY2B]|nr:hypothetical protein PBCVIL52s1_572L [Paramecium bursaria Chlorella virus IL-5-2s1]AGE58396.1 hypothetical protein PBCVNY2B_551L [Paramecium bursaria Chlorella virus NY2B]